MRTWVIRWTTWRRRLLFVAVMSAIGVLFCAPQAAQNGVRHGLAVCAQLLVPSLFPFLVIAGFLVKGGFLQSLGRRVEPLMRWAFGFGGNAAGAILLSMIGGYPAGATAVVGLLQNGDIDRGSAKRLLRVTVHAGPAFVIGGIICCIAQAVRDVGENWLSMGEKDAGTLASVTLIFLAVLLTALGVFDKLGKFAGGGTFVPITGFANSIASAAMEFRSEGAVLGMGAKLFTVAGPVIVWGVTSAVIYGVIYWLCSLF